MSYKPRVTDAELENRMRRTGAVLIEGPKACGKTSTASRVAATVFEMDRDVTARGSIELNQAYLFDRPTPILFDEWQATPELWNLVRRAAASISSWVSGVAMIKDIESGRVEPVSHDETVAMARSIVAGRQ